MKLFSIRGIPIGAHWSLFIALGLFAYTYGGLVGVALGLGLFASVLLHELGHAVVAQRRRIPIAGIDLHLFGGVAKMTEPPRSPKDEMAIAIAGPLVSLALGVIGVGASYVIPPTAPAAIQFAQWLGGANLVLFVFNLLPALPMDGGRVLRAWLAERHGLVKGTQAAVKVSRALALALGVAGLFYNPWWVALAVLIWALGNAEVSQMKRHEALHRMGYRNAEIDPWARYDKACDTPPEVEVLTGPERAPAASHPGDLLAHLMGQAPGTAPAPGPQKMRSQRFARDSMGRVVVVQDETYRW